jgi:hypothetical protein
MFFSNSYYSTFHIIVKQIWRGFTHIIISEFVVKDLSCSGIKPINNNGCMTTQNILYKT